MEPELIDVIYLWSYRLAVLFLTAIAVLYHRKKRNRISLIILIGTGMVFCTHVTDYLAYPFLLHKETLDRWRDVVVVTKLLSIPSYFIAVLGCFLSVIKSEVTSPSNAKGW